MKIRYGDYQLSDGALEGTSGFTLNGQQINDRFDLYRALTATFTPRGNRSAVLSFSVNRQKDSIHASERFVLEHFWQLPEQADLLLYIGTDDDGEWVKFTGAVIDSVPTFYRGVSPGVQYSFSVGGPPSFSQPPPDFIEPDDSMIKREVIDIPAAATTMDVVFVTPFSGAPVLNQPSVQIPAGGDDIRALVVKDSVTNTGFSVEFTGAIPGSGYALSYWAIG